MPGMGSDLGPAANRVAQNLNLESEINGFISQVDIFFFKAIEHFVIARILRPRPAADSIRIRERRIRQLECAAVRADRDCARTVLHRPQHPLAVSSAVRPKFV